MKKNLFFGLAVITLLAINIGAKGNAGSEDELKEKAKELFEAQNYKEAKLIYAQLLSLYPKDPTYNYRFGACVLQTEADKTKPLKYLNFAASKANVDPLAYFYLGKAYHLNYNFAEAVKQYSKFKNKANSDEKEKYSVDRQIEMCKNGNNLLTTLNEVQVLERQTIAEKDFYRIYDEDAIGGNIIVMPEQFKSKYDKKQDEKSVVFLPKDAKEVYYSSYGKKGENGKDIYKAVKLGNGEWSEGVSLGSSINTPFDEDYAYIKPDGRTLYFASKGHTSMGGYDVFRSVLDAATGKWTEPENLDFAFNSADDDFMFVTDQAEITAYFTSKRANEFGEVTVYKVLTERAPAELSVISGTFISESNPEQKKAKITVIDKASQETIGVYETDEKGKYSIEIAKNGGEYQFNVETNEVDPIHTGVVSIPKQEEFEVLGQELRLVGLGNEQQLVIKNIFDGTASSSMVSQTGPVISSELIKLKANLEVNYNSSDLAILQQRAKDRNSASLSQDVQSTEKSNLVAEEEIANTSELDKNGNNEDNLDTEATEDATGPELSVVAMTEELKTLRTDKNNLIDSKQKVVGNQFSIANELEKEATALFNEADKMKADGADTTEINEKRKQGGIKALQASVAAQLGQDIEASINDDLAELDDFESSESDINRAIGENDLQTANKLLNEARAKNENSESVDEIIANSLESIDERSSLADKKISDFSSKSESFKEEKNTLNNLLTDYNEQLESAKGNEKEELLSNIENTELDLRDLEYQFGLVNENIKEAALAKKSISIEKGEVKNASERINAETQEQVTISEEEKSNLFNQLKKYREGNQLAYAVGNDLYASDESIYVGENSSEEIAEAVSSEKGSNSLDLNVEEQETPLEQPEGDYAEPEESYEYQTAFSINEKYSEEVNAIENIEDEDLKLANKIQVYDNWIDDLQKKKVEVKSAYDSEIDENKRSIWKIELDELSASINDRKKSKEKVESELAAIASGQFVADTAPINSANEITEGSIVNSDFTNLAFNQKTKPSTAQSAVQLIEAKKALFEASELAKQQEIAQESAYTLPTAEERTEAFATANRLKKESENKQLEAASKFAAFNRKEYQLNREKINQANNIDERYATDGRDIAILLSEEANDFFTDAAILRAEINETDRLSQKEVNLQKAYDYELLGLKKQREALEKLGMVVSESLSEESDQENVIAEPFIQVIESQEILSVIEAPKAKQAAEDKIAEVFDVESKIEIEDSIANEMDSGTERDSVLAIVKDLKQEKDQLQKEAALYYERERQIKEGLVGVTPSNRKSTAQVLTLTKPAIEISLDTVNIDGERERLVLESNDFKAFANNRQNLVNQTKAAEVAYQEAIDLAEENQRLQKQAIIESNMAKVVEDETEKQRLMKSAEVIESKVKSNKAKIESINQSIKVKNILIQSLVEKDKSYLAALSGTEKQEFVYLSNNLTPEIATSDLIADLPSSSTADSETNSFVYSDETAEEPSEINSISPLNDEPKLPNNNVEENELVDTDVTSETTKGSADGNQTRIEAEKKVEPRANTNTAATPKVPIEMENIDVVPREVKQAIFVKLNNNESAYGENKPIPTQVSLPQGIVYKVQVGAFRKEIPANTFKGFAPLMAEPSGTGITRYTAGLFAKENNAVAARDEIRKIGYPDAFVVAFQNGKRISVAKARGEGGANETAAAAVTFPKVGSSSNGSAPNTVTSAEEVTQVPGGSKEALPAAFSDDEIEEVVNTKTIEGVYYTIQIGVFSSPVKKGVFNYEGLNVVQLPSGLYRYNAGIFNSVLQAADLKNTITQTISDAFVTAYYNGKRISLTEASKLKNQ